MIKKILYGAILIIVLLIGAYFGLLNKELVIVDFFFVSLTISVSVLIMIVFSIGLVLGALGIYLFIVLPLQTKHFFIQKKIRKNSLLSALDVANRND